MRVLLVSPKSSFPDITPSWLRIPQLVLPIVAGLTPSEHEVLIVEEEFERLPLGDNWDVVGITAMTATAPRAYELASLFKRNGVRVILGGIHPSVLPDEAALFGDAVVVGEAEGVWETGAVRCAAKSVEEILLQLTARLIKIAAPCAPENTVYPGNAVLCYANYGFPWLPL
jgi:radical SAM superfamily enzyme YgiQ (UPF0313 family)